ncbi:MAG: hypothetical protein E7589_05395 [Ruminococcaceae bacterium]|nr:hypothetical protein [Oscillospiraceae bacterium]
MEDYKYLREIESVSSGNGFVKYIANRVASNEYRGVQCSQHNRLTFEYFSRLISVIYNVAGTSVFKIHVGDDFGDRQPQAKTYYEIVDGIKLATGKGTVNSVKKNTFPDIARMGFLNRYDKNGVKIIENGSRTSVYSVGLSALGCRFAQATPFEKIKLFTDGIDILTKNTASELVEILYLNDFGVDSIDLLEFMYIFSDDRDGITTNDKLRLLLEYRRLSASDKEKINNNLKLFCNPENRKDYDNKLLLRDYSNWKNESQQIYGLLANSTYFKVEKNKLILNTGNYGLFDVAANRGAKAKSEYFKAHGITKTKGYDLHHIVPFSKAQNKSDAVYIDDFKNLIYLKDAKHDEFTIAGSKHVIMKYTQNNPHILFMDVEDTFILVDVDKDALVSKSFLPKVKEYNEMLLRKFYYM